MNVNPLADHPKQIDTSPYAFTANNPVEFYIQDYIVNKFLKAKLTGNTEEMGRLKKENSKIEEVNQERWEFILKLESMGVDFRNYNYKK